MIFGVQDMRPDGRTLSLATARRVWASQAAMRAATGTAPPDEGVASVTLTFVDTGHRQLLSAEGRTTLGSIDPAAVPTWPALP